MAHPEGFHIRNWLRVAAVFLPLSVVDGYWATYSADVVNGTSLDSVWPPIHILFTLGLMAGLLAPVHRSLQKGTRWSGLLAGAILWAVLAGILAAVASAWPGLASSGQFVGAGATFLSLVLWIPCRRFLQRTRPLDARELLALYGLLTTGTLVQGFGAAHFILPFIMGPHYFASPSNHWATQLFPVLSKRLFITNDIAAHNFYTGGRTGVPWAMWATPLALWTVYIMLICLVMLGLNGLVRRLWTENERLTFPQVYLPLEMARQEEGPVLNRFFRNPLMWVGFFLAALLESTAGIHQYFPSTPSFQFRHINLLQGWPAPWTSVGGLDISLYPCIVGISYLLTVELSGSTWLFYLVRKLLPIVGSQFGWQDTLAQDGSPFPWPDQQSTGAFITIAILTLWGVFSRLRQAHNEGAPRPVSKGEATALVVGLALLIVWTRLLGISILVSIGFVAAFFVVSLAYTRIRAEAGLGGLTGPMPPQDALVDCFGSRAFSAHDLAGLGSLRWSSWDLRFLPSVMPAQLETYKIGDQSGIPARGLFWGMLLAVFVCLLISYVTELPILYHYGANQMNYLRCIQIPMESMTMASRYISNPKGPDITGLSAGAFGMLFTWILALMRFRFFSFPLHPLGYAIGFSRRTMDWMWLSIFLGWLAKTITLRAGGLRAYRVMLPLFLGMLLGDFTAGAVFGILGCIFPQTTGYSVYP